MPLTLLQSDVTSLVVSQPFGSTVFRPLCGHALVSEAAAEVDSQILIRSSYQLTLLTAFIHQNSLNGASTIRSRVNGANGTLAISVAAGATGTAVDTGPGDSLVDGDLVCTQSVTGGTSGSYRPLRIYYGLSDSIGSKTIVGSVGQTGFGEFTASTNRWLPIFGRINAAGTDETLQPYTFRYDATFSNLRVRVNQNSIANPSTFRTRKNGANGGQSVSITGSTTGSFEDTTGTDTVTDGDSLNYQVEPGA